MSLTEELSKSGPSIAPRHLSSFVSGRLPIDWETAEVIYSVVNNANIESIGVTGSLHPSILLSLSDGAPNRDINTFASQSMWSEGSGWQAVLDDSGEAEDSEAWPVTGLPNNVHFWDGATPFFKSEAIFSDLPFSHPALGMDLKFLNHCEHKLVLLGFLEEHDGPDDLLDWVKQRNYKIDTHIGKIKFLEKSLELEYKLVMAHLN